MRIHTIEGQIETLGESWKKQGTTKRYDYISLRDKDGQDMVVREIGVYDEIDRLLFPGMYGTFIFTEAWFSKEMVAVRTADREAICEFLQSGTTKYYLATMVVLLIGLLLSIVLIGIPIVVLAIYILMNIGSTKRKLLEATRKAGFRHVATKII